MRLNLITAQIKGEFLSELVDETVQKGIKEAQQEEQKKVQKLRKTEMGVVSFGVNRVQLGWSMPKKIQPGTG